MKSLHHPDRKDFMLPAVLHALSDPIRLHMVAQMYRSGEQACKNFDVPIANSTRSQHIRTLRESGIIYTRFEGTKRLLSLRTEDLNERFPGLIDSILNVYESDKN
ncbi:MULTISPECIES: ArsR/SmtB family transcription factor [Paenibacillus]|uniref:ArsR family transcriptional regulator n=1 Tax=Paenibacillus illinoisensis TaxID=59845 RepID=A0A2W0CCU4_9BACL|nr:MULTISPECIES: helix-turn-helix transcriptional regulator [Paenibacillus]PAD29584.1 transcriptional regulator [Paenibacillus sp. 7523-1]PYY27942.1 ArsR family transcriptional regulator [Paenibacillus illinoisensis]